jgi:Fe-S cluster assembly protein SufD
MAETTKIKGPEDLFVTDFVNNRHIICRNDTPKIRNLRSSAIESFSRLGFPTLNDELWRFTNIRKLLEESGRLVHPFTPPADVNTPVKEIFQCDINELDTYDLALINGWFPQTLPLLQKLDTGGIIGSFAEALELYPEVVDLHFGLYAKAENDAFTALNTAFASDGIFGYFPDNSVMIKPLQVVSLVNVEEGSLLKPLVQYRNLFVIGKNCSVKIVLCDHTLNNNPSLTNSVTEVFLGENSTLELYRLQNQNNLGAQVSMLHVHQEANSRLLSNMLSLNGGFIRNNINITLDGEGAETNLYGVYLMDRKQHIDNNSAIIHNKPNCTSNQLYKGILDDQAKGVFRGRILVERDAQHTNSYQKNNNLLLTDDTVADTMPQLEIYADDVKCSHGATVGYLGTEELFYLRSRGICEKEARILLMNAFAVEIIDKIQIPTLRDRIYYLVSKRLRGELSHCASCVLRCRD